MKFARGTKVYYLEVNHGRRLPLVGPFREVAEAGGLLMVQENRAGKAPSQP